MARVPYSEFTPEKGAAFEAAEATEAALKAAAVQVAEQEEARKRALHAEEAKAAQTAAAAAAAAAQPPPTALHGPEVHSPATGGSAPLATPGMNGLQILAALTDERSKAIVQKYGFDLRGLEVTSAHCTCPALLIKLSRVCALNVTCAFWRSHVLAQCQVQDGREVCYADDGFTREKCPPHVNSVFLTLAAGQWSCQPVSRDFSCHWLSSSTCALRH